MSEGKIQVRWDAGEVHLSIPDGAVPWQIADELARALTIAARKAEEYCKANDKSSKKAYK